MGRRGECVPEMVYGYKKWCGVSKHVFGWDGANYCAIYGFQSIAVAKQCDFGEIFLSVESG